MRSSPPIEPSSSALIAERAGIDFVSLDDGFDPAPDRPDALLVMARVAPATTSIGLVATITTTHTEPFHVSKNVASARSRLGRTPAAARRRVLQCGGRARRFGRKGVQSPDELYAEADDAIEVVSRLWDSWEDDAVIRDRPTGRYLDRAKVHYIDFEGPFFNVRGPSITPRSPQGQPLLFIDARDEPSRTLRGEARRHRSRRSAGAFPARRGRPRETTDRARRRGRTGR